MASVGVSRPEVGAESLPLGLLQDPQGEPVDRGRSKRVRYVEDTGRESVQTNDFNEHFVAGTGDPVKPLPPPPSVHNDWPRLPGLGAAQHVSGLTFLYKGTLAGKPCTFSLIRVLVSVSLTKDGCRSTMLS